MASVTWHFGISGAGSYGRDSPEEACSCRVCQHHEYWNRGANIAGSLTYGQIRLFLRKIFFFYSDYCWC